MLEIVEKARRGMALTDILIIDCHCHMGYWHNFNVPDGSEEGMISSMNALGTDMACITAHSSIGPDYKYGNDIVIEAVKKYPNRFIGYSTLNPNYSDDMKNEIDRCFSIPGIRGIKLHPSCHGSTIDHKNYKTAYEEACKRRCPLLIHVWGNNDVMAINSLAHQYPEAQFIMGHGGGEIRAMETAIDIVNKHDNVYVDLALSFAREGNVEWFVKEMGSKKVLFGSDMPFFDPSPAFGRVAFAEIEEDEKLDIFGGNMLRLLKM